MYTFSTIKCIFTSKVVLCCECVAMLTQRSSFRCAIYTMPMYPFAIAPYRNAAATQYNLLHCCSRVAGCVQAENKACFFFSVHYEDSTSLEILLSAVANSTYACASFIAASLSTIHLDDVGNKYQSLASLHLIKISFGHSFEKQ